MEYPNANPNPNPDPYHHPIPIPQPPLVHQNPTLNPNPNPNHYPNLNPSVVYQQYNSSTRTVVPLPYPFGPPEPAESRYPGGPYPYLVTTFGGDHNGGNGGLPSYYHGPNCNANSGFEAYSLNPPGYPNSAGYAFANYKHNLGTPSKGLHQIKSRSRKISKKIKIRRSFPCDVCKIICDTEEVLKKHRLGKKHKESLEKLKAVVSGQSISPTIVSTTSTPKTVDMDAPRKGKKKKKKKVSEAGEDLETKKKRALDNGAAMNDMKTCSICKVVCSGETVFQYHLSGKKHAAMVTKQTSGTPMASVS